MFTKSQRCDLGSSIKRNKLKTSDPDVVCELVKVPTGVEIVRSTPVEPVVAVPEVEPEAKPLLRLTRSSSWFAFARRAPSDHAARPMPNGTIWVYRPHGGINHLPDSDTIVVLEVARRRVGIGRRAGRHGDTSMKHPPTARRPVRPAHSSSGRTHTHRPNDLAAYLAECAATLAVATLVRRLAAIARAHHARGVPSPTRAEVVRATMRGIRRRCGTAQRQARPLLRDELFRTLDTHRRRHEGCARPDAAAWSVLHAGCRRSETRRPRRARHRNRPCRVSVHSPPAIEDGSRRAQAARSASPSVARASAL